MRTAAITGLAPLRGLSRILLEEQVCRAAEAVVGKDSAAPAISVGDLHAQVRDAAAGHYRDAILRFLAVMEADVLAAKRRKRTEDEVLTLWLMLMEDAGEEAYASAAASLSNVPGQVASAGTHQSLRQEASAFAQSRQSLLGNFPAEVHSQLRKAAREIPDASQDHKAARQRVRAVAKELEARGEVIAQTEAQATYGSAEVRALERAGFATKVWMTMEDERVRHSHVLCGEQGEVAMGQTFVNGLRFPGDPNGGPEEVVNCRCWLTGGRRVAQADARDSGLNLAVTAASPKFGCLMTMLPQVQSAAVGWSETHIEPGTLVEDGIETETHATVLYGFKVDFQVAALAELLQVVAPVELTLGKVERFECERYDVIKVGVESADLVKLNALLASVFEADIKPSAWAYHPHVTLAYVAKGTNRHLDGSTAFEGNALKVGRLLYSLPEKQGRCVLELAEQATVAHRYFTEEQLLEAGGAK